MKKSIVAMSIALLVASLGASLALASPDVTSSTQGMMMTSPMTNSTTGFMMENGTGSMMGTGMGSMMTTDQMDARPNSGMTNSFMSSMMNGLNGGMHGH